MHTDAVEHFGSQLNLESDEVRPVAEVCQRLTGKRPSPATIWRWIRRGCRGQQLDAVQVQGQWQTTTAEFARFVRAKSQPLAPTQKPSERDAATEKRLNAAGLLDPKERGRP